MKQDDKIVMDAFRITGQDNFKVSDFRKNPGFMTLYYFRKIQSAKSLLGKKIYKHLYFKYANKNGIEIPDSVILGGGRHFDSSL